MAMKTKKERFHVGALNQDLKGGNEQREKVEEEEEGGGLLQNTLFNFTSHTVGDKIQGGVVGGDACWGDCEKFAHRFGVQLVSVLRQNLLHAGLVCVCDKPEAPGRKNRRGKGKKRG